VILAIDIGGTKIVCGLVDPRSGRVSGALSTPTPAQAGAQAVLDATIALARRLPNANLDAIGVGANGQVDVAQGRIGYAGPTMPGWAGADLRGALGDAFGLPVFVDNDVNALALGEARFGAARDLRSALFVAVGTGVGGAILIEGALWHGHSNTAGEIGSLLVDVAAARASDAPLAGCVESYASGPSMAARYNALMPSAEPLDLRAVHARAQHGDPTARLVIADGARVLGFALRGALNLFDPHALVIGGGVASLGALWWDALLDVLRSNPQPGVAKIQILPAALGADAPLAGAAAVAIPR
jgi:glucokinase